MPLDAEGRWTSPTGPPTFVTPNESMGTAGLNELDLEGLEAAVEEDELRERGIDPDNPAAYLPGRHPIYDREIW